MTRAPRHGDVATPANRLREVRCAYLITQKELAARTGISLGTIQNVERGNNCRFSTRRRLIQFFGLKLRDHTRIFP